MNYSMKQRMALLMDKMTFHDVGKTFGLLIVCLMVILIVWSKVLQMDDLMVHLLA